MSTVLDPRKTWLATGSLLTIWWRIHLWGWDCTFPSGSGCRAPPPPPTSLPLAGEWDHLQLASSPLVFTQSFVLWAGQAVPQSFLQESSLSLSLFFLSHWLSHSLGCYIMLAPSDCPQCIQTQSLPLSKQPTPPGSSPARCWQTQASGLLLCQELCLAVWSVCVVFFFPSQLCCPLRFQNSPQTHQWEGFLVFGNFSFTTPSPGRVSIPNSSICLYLLHFVLPPFKENGLPFWVLGVLRQRSEVVLWNLLNVQMIFWWICGGESCLPILFLCHLRTDPLSAFQIL